MNRQAMLDALLEPKQEWDVVVIGGGATGLGAALDAATRGYRTALLEAQDFAKGTSSRSTKLIHGGVRYLRQGQIQMVRESLLERGRLERNAAHIVSARQFVIPAYSVASRYYFYAGMKAYDLLAGKFGFTRSRMLSPEQTLMELPTLKAAGLRGGVSYFDGQFDDARLAIVLAQTLVDQGGIALNYAPVVRLQSKGCRITGVVARDSETNHEFSLQAKVVINATGVFAESVMQMDESADNTASDRPTIVASQGTHLVLSPDFMPGSCAMLIPHTDDSRVLFAIPWQGRTLLGTTDTPANDIAFEPRPLQHEIDYLLEHAGRYLNKQPLRSDVLSAFSGLRPLVGKRQQSPSRQKTAQPSTAQMTREHEIYTSNTGLITILGGKWTTYRKMGQAVIDRAQHIASLPKKRSGTVQLALHGSVNSPSDSKRKSHPQASDRLSVYGANRGALLELADSEPTWSELLSERLPYIAAEVAWAVKHEMARTVEDVLARRTRALLLDAQASSEIAATTAHIMQALLHRSEDWKIGQIRDFERIAKGYLLG